MKDFSDDDLRMFSDCIAKLPPPQPATEPADAARLESGRALIRGSTLQFLPQPDLAGRDNVPRIAGQRRTSSSSDFTTRPKYRREYCHCHWAFQPLRPDRCASAIAAAGRQLGPLWVKI